MSLYHFIWLFFDMALFVVSCVFRRGVIWLGCFGFTVAMAYMALTTPWESVLYGIFFGLVTLVSIMGFIFESLNDRFLFW